MALALTYAKKNNTELPSTCQLCEATFLKGLWGDKLGIMEDHVFEAPLAVDYPCHGQGVL